MANAEFIVWPWQACLMLNKTRQVVKAVVGRPRHERTVSGLNRYLA